MELIGPNGEQEMQAANAPVAVDARYTEIRSAVGWMWAIPIVTTLNAVAMMLGMGWRLVVGLVSTDLIVAIASSFGLAGSLFGFFFSLAIIAAFTALTWVFKKKGAQWAAITVMVVYALDMIPTVFVQDWFGLGFHALTLYMIGRGVLALRSLVAERAAARPVEMQPAVAEPAPTPPL